MQESGTRGQKLNSSVPTQRGFGVSRNYTRWRHCSWINGIRHQSVWRTGIAEQTSEHGEVEVVEYDSDWCEFVDSVKDMRSGITLEWKGVDNKVGEQPWPQLVRCASICCRVCGCVFQEDWIVARSLGEEWYRLIRARIGQGKDVNDFNLQTKGLGCNYWSTYTKSGIGGVQVISLHRDSIGVDNRSLGSKN